MPDLARVQYVYKRYVDARNALLDELQLTRKSNRDPLSEFSEWLVKELVGGTLAPSPVQKDWDVQTPNGETYQVKYLANSTEKWVNEHPISVNAAMKYYALVIFEDLLPQAVIIFPANNLARVGEMLKKKHPNQDKILQFTKANYTQIIKNIASFSGENVRVFLAPDWHQQ